MIQMIKVEGIFKCMEIKEISGKKCLKLSNSDKDKDGKYKNTYYDLWINEKSGKLFSNDIKRKLKDKCMLDIKGWLKVVYSEKYTNLVLYPTAVKEYKKP
jgi:hypothetical protein